MQTTHARLGSEDLLPPGQAASYIGVHPDTLKRWEKASLLTSVRTPTGHRRYRRGDLDALLKPVPTEDGAR